jgi:hypothetical protein
MTRFQKELLLISAHHLKEMADPSHRVDLAAPYEVPEVCGDPGEREAVLMVMAVHHGLQRPNTLQALRWIAGRLQIAADQQKGGE